MEWVCWFVPLLQRAFGVPPGLCVVVWEVGVCVCGGGGMGGGGCGQSECWGWRGTVLWVTVGCLSHCSPLPLVTFVLLFRSAAGGRKAAPGGCVCGPGSGGARTCDLPPPLYSSLPTDLLVKDALAFGLRRAYLPSVVPHVLLVVLTDPGGTDLIPE